MEKERTEKIKESFLAGFVAVCVALICILWFNAFLDKDEGNPYFYRGTPERSAFYYETQTAIVEQIKSGTGTPTPEHRREHETPTPTVTPVLPPTPEADD
jgi:hypothetical protein